MLAYAHAISQTQKKHKQSERHFVFMGVFSNTLQKWRQMETDVLEKKDHISKIIYGT